MSRRNDRPPPAAAFAKGTKPATGTKPAKKGTSEATAAPEPEAWVRTKPAAAPAALASPLRVALVTGASRGIGVEIARRLSCEGHVVFVGARDAEAGRRVAKELSHGGHDVRFVRLDVTDEASIADAVAVVAETPGHLDVLVNNAGILLDETRKVTELPADLLRQTIETNVVGALAVSRAFLPLLVRGRSPRIVNVSSTAGSLHDMAAAGHGMDGWRAPAYRVSKAALNALTIVLANELKPAGVTVNACCPGWVRTGMGGPSAPLSPAEGADTPVWLATLPDGGPTGGFFSERAPHPW